MDRRFIGALVTATAAILCADRAALAQDTGSIVAWGRNFHGQCNVPEPNHGFVAVAGGGYHSLGLKADGSIVAWGCNEYNQCEVPAPNEDFVAVAGGAGHSLGLKAGAPSCPADFDGDGEVDTADLLHLLGAWGTPDGDVDGDGDTDTADLLALLAAWGECP